MVITYAYDSPKHYVISVLDVFYKVFVPSGVYLSKQFHPAKF